MNRLKLEKQTAILGGLVEGLSIRSAERMTGVHRDTIGRLLQRVGTACEALMDRKMRNLPCEHIELDEIWTFVQKKQRHIRPSDNPNVVGDFWVWVSLCADSKIVPTYRVGKRDTWTVDQLLADLAPRLQNRLLISSDGLRAYVQAVRDNFGTNVDFAQIVKSYEAEPIGEGRYSPPKVTKVEKWPVFGNPDMSRVSTSYVERQNLTMRMSMRRFTRLTNAHSKSFQALEAAVALHFAWYNFVRIHSTLGTTPAVAAGIETSRWTIPDLLAETN